MLYCPEGWIRSFCIYSSHTRLIRCLTLRAWIHLLQYALTNLANLEREGDTGAACSGSIWHLRATKPDMEKGSPIIIACNKPRLT